MTSPRFVALDLMDLESGLFSCMCGKCNQAQVQLARFMILVTARYSLIIGRHQDLALLNPPQHGHGNGIGRADPVPCICIKDSDLMRGEA